MREFAAARKFFARTEIVYTFAALHELFVEEIASRIVMSK